MKITEERLIEELKTIVVSAERTREGTAEKEVYLMATTQKYLCLYLLEIIENGVNDELA